MTAATIRQPKRLADYQPPSFLVSKTDLSFELDPTATRVSATLTFQRNGAGIMILDGQQLKLISLRLNGQMLTDKDYRLTEDSLEIVKPGNSGVLEIVTELNPDQNSALEGLYLAEGVYCTQCEAEGFRRITYYPDRPDVLAVFTTTIIADSSQLPFLLSNGNKVSETLLSDGRTAVKWHDPFPKPAYLFALVAGDFDCLTDAYVTASGRQVSLEFYVQKGALSRSHFAMAALKRAMHWDEQRFGLEYDLDRYMVVAVDFFNMGAMENKGLNVFNSKYVLADDSSATDQDYFNIESIIGHEYFHNWTGNRVTCRDWFQLSLKEGLTVFRDQEFSADMGSATLNRIEAVKLIRTAQFAEDASPMAHPIRPEQVLEMNNFYTVTVYDKGAEVIRMLQTILGKTGFNAGLKCYLDRHDGQAVTCDDFVQAMQDATGQDLTQFRRWYSQSGTPEVKVQEHYDATSARLTLKLHQHTPVTADQTIKQPLLMPMRIELLFSNAGSSMRQLLLLSNEEQEFQFDGIHEQPLIVWLEDFSAPVKLSTHYQPEQLLLIAGRATNGFARWDAMQQYWSLLISKAVTGGLLPQLPAELVSLFKQLLQQPLADIALTAELLALPDFDTLAEQYTEIPVDALLSCLAHLTQQLAEALAIELTACYQRFDSIAYHYNEQGVALRALKGRCLHYLAFTNEGEHWVNQHYRQADNMTDQLTALKAAQYAELATSNSLLEDFAKRYQHNVQVMDKYFSLVATTPNDAVFTHLDRLTQHSLFSWKNPNRVRAVFGAFSQRNAKQFHRADGRGYQLLAQIVTKLDPINPQLAARLLTPLLSWQRYDQQRQHLLAGLLKALAAQASLSNDVFEKVSKSLP
ncbi:aminopeptidase N [Alishewanella longhuensis]|uniref:Aminopeptidase N n=1 Tax=Alishewanella longhuensis TaxID=1091037 RepID=A0ABQ3L4J2_9ALTE|nr:aminopeptidase N [Alishewanella longhuensis]GHG77141.1 aminopeptidase N [Alishewanella longhuensis]